MILHYKTAALVALLPMLHAADVLGRGHGLDHVGIVAHDLALAEDVFRALGFTIGERGWLPDGTRDTSIDFQNQSQYLELITVTDRAKASVRQGDLVAFSDQREGAFFIGLDISSAGRAAALLRSRGWNVDGPAGNSWTPEGIADPFPEGWLRVRIGLPVFFIEYHDKVYKELEKKYPQIKQDPKLEQHGNGALALRAAWIGVNDLEKAAAAYERAGLVRGRRLPIEPLHTEAQEMKAGAGSILLVPSPSDGVIGVTIVVRDIEMARAAAGRDLPLYAGPFGHSVVIPPARALGMHVEFSERRR